MEIRINILDDKVTIGKPILGRAGEAAEQKIELTWDEAKEIAWVFGGGRLQKPDVLKWKKEAKQ